MAIDRMHPQLSINKQCTLLGLSKGGLYYSAVPENPYNLELMDLIDRQYLDTPFYGSRKMTVCLKNNGHNVNRKRVISLMRQMGISAIYPGPNTSKRRQDHKVFPYLIRGLNINSPNHVWAIDITYIRLLGGYAYLVAIIDWHSRIVLAWQLSNSLESGFCIEAVDCAINNFGPPQIINTDQGCQFTSDDFTKFVLGNGVQISMDGKGRALDNIMIERLWRSLKYEEIYLKGYADRTMKEANLGLSDYFDFYNNKRPHQSLGYLTPSKIHLRAVC